MAKRESLKGKYQLMWARDFLEAGLTGALNLKMDKYREWLIEVFGTDQLDKVRYDEGTDQYIIED